MAGHHNIGHREELSQHVVLKHFARFVAEEIVFFTFVDIQAFELDEKLKYKIATTTTTTPNNNTTNNNKLTKKQQQQQQQKQLSQAILRSHTGRANLSALEGIQKGLRLNQTTTARVDQNHALLHLGKRFPASKLTTRIRTKQRL
jgi:hypothetical protein